VYLLAMGDVRIEGSITLNGGDVGPYKAGKGGPGGFDGGETSTSAAATHISNGVSPGGAGYGPGGGRCCGVAGSYATGESPYGNTLLTPLIGGSGSAGYVALTPYGGAGGGGAMNGQILAIGGAGAQYSSNAGSGGAVRLIAPKVQGNGSIATWGGPCQYCDVGGLGRIRIDTLNAFDLNFKYGGVVRQGREMYVFAPNNPRLEIFEAAGVPIADGAAGVVNIQLPPSASTNQTVKIRAYNFSGRIPLEVVVVPDDGLAFKANSEFEGNSTGPVEITVTVNLLPDRNSRIQAWTR